MEAVTERYEFLHLIRDGAHGRVYEARCKTTGTHYAVKVVEKKPAEMVAVRREIAVGDALRHSHIAQLHETMETKRQIFIVQELLRGGDLCDAIDPSCGGINSVANTRLYMAQITAALAHMHSKGIVHRDIKPENIVLDEAHKTAKLVDFGSAYMPGQPSSGASGTLLYMAPEMLCKESPAHVYTAPQQDVWSLGIVLHCLLTGSFPWRKSTSDDVHFRRYCEMHAAGDASFFDRSIAGISDGLRALLHGMLAPCATERMTLAEVAALLYAPWTSAEFAMPRSM